MKTYTVGEAAEKFKVGKRVVQGLCLRGLLPNAAKKPSGFGFDVWEILESDLEGFVPPNRPGRPGKRSLFEGAYSPNWNVPVKKLNELVEKLQLADLSVFVRADAKGNDAIHIGSTSNSTVFATFESGDKQKACDLVSNFLYAMAMGIKYHAFNEHPRRLRTASTARR